MYRQLYYCFPVTTNEDLLLPSVLLFLPSTHLYPSCLHLWTVVVPRTLPVAALASVKFLAQTGALEYRTRCVSLLLQTVRGVCLLGRSSRLSGLSVPQHGRELRP